jgi:hypothetical protein
MSVAWGLRMFNAKVTGIARQVVVVLGLAACAVLEPSAIWVQHGVGFITALVFANVVPVLAVVLPLVGVGALRSIVEPAERGAGERLSWICMVGIGASLVLTFLVGLSTMSYQAVLATPIAVWIMTGIVAVIRDRATVLPTVVGVPLAVEAAAVAAVVGTTAGGPWLGVLSVAYVLVNVFVPTAVLPLEWVRISGRHSVRRPTKPGGPGRSAAGGKPAARGRSVA